MASLPTRLACRGPRPRRFVLTLALGWLAGCASAYGRVSELRSRTVLPDRFKTVVVIAGDDEQADLQIAARVRQSLIQAGLTVVRRSGLWDNEQVALEDICPAGEPATVDGVLFVWWNQLTLRDCASRTTAYQIRGGLAGTDQLVRRLLQYLRSRPQPG